MNALLDAISRVIRKPSDGRDHASERFLARCENFRLLLAANNKALETMAEMTEDSRSGRVFGMAHVRAQVLKVAAAVRQMIERLCRMHPGRYDGLRGAFNRIVLEAEGAMAEGVRQDDGPLVLPMDSIRSAHVNETGSKMALLGEIRGELGIPVPKGFSITASAFRLFMEGSGLDDEINRLIQIADGFELEELRSLERSIRHAINLAAMPLEFEQAVEAECGRLGGTGRPIRLAVRSSAIGEDSKEASFAGQFLTVLGVAPAGVAEAYRNVVASMYSATAMTYRLTRGLREDGLVMCVGCLEMVDALAGGVVYTRDPLGRHPGAMLVSAVPGLPSEIVDGSSAADTWVVERETLALIHAEIGDKTWRSELAPGGGIRRRKLRDEFRWEPSVADATVQAVAAMARRIEAHFGSPQDIEWAMGREGELYILQCRPLTLCAPCEAPDERASGTAGDHAAHPTKDDDAPFALLSGCTPASPGVAVGTIHLVEGDDMLDFPEGAILLARNARPRLSALLPRAAGLVAENGNATGHLANIAREFGIPALVGATGAVDRLGGVGVVTLNADTGVVYLGRRGQASRERATPAMPPETAVTAALRRVLPHVVPLSLTDPDSSDFAPESCVSFHDITRFCHEKAVAEMFREGEAPGAKARRLVGEGALQFWLVDVGGGTTASGDDEYVGLADVASNAMQALWTGMTAVPWDGPPAVDAGGFMSIVFEASQNPALAPGAANPMAERNYFIVGRNYCNLQSRFGFHFCTIEGFAGEDRDRNYVFFQFKGGAADRGRRTVRARLVAEVLERHGFIAEVRDDALFARLEGVSRQTAERALAVAGYLLVHTRQIDMVMADPGARGRYARRFDSEIQSMLAAMGPGSVADGNETAPEQGGEAKP
jgi:pyruvate,water dikinase